MTEEMYAEGDWIVHVNYGVGQVKGKDTKTMEGKKRKFLKVKTFSSEYFLPVRKWDVPHIRRLSSEYQMKKALSILRKPPKPLSKHHKERYNQILDAASDISIYAKAKIIRDLHGKRLAGKLNYRDKVSLEKISEKFLDEWSIVSELEKAELREKLEIALQTSFKKIKTDESWIEKVRKGVKVRKNQENTS